MSKGQPSERLGRKNEKSERVEKRQIIITEKTKRKPSQQQKRMKHEECLTCCQFNGKRCHCTHVHNSANNRTTGREYKKRKTSWRACIRLARSRTDSVQQKRLDCLRLRNVWNSLNGSPIPQTQCFVCDVSFFFIDFRLCISPDQLDLYLRTNISPLIFFVFWKISLLLV